MIFRSKTPSKGKTAYKSVKSPQKSKKIPLKARVVWEDSAVPQEHQDHTIDDTSTNSINVEKSSFTGSKLPKIHYYFIICC